MAKLRVAPSAATAARVTSLDRVIGKVLMASALCRRFPEKPVSVRWLKVVGDYNAAQLIVPGVRPYRPARGLTVPKARQRLLRLAQRMGRSSCWLRPNREEARGKA